MTETRTVFDPFLRKKVEINNDLVKRLRGLYAKGPTMENGEPEFGWEQYPTTPLKLEAAEEIERLRKEIESLERFKTLYLSLRNHLEDLAFPPGDPRRGGRTEAEILSEVERKVKGEGK